MFWKYSQMGDLNYKIAIFYLLNSKKEKKENENNWPEEQYYWMYSINFTWSSLQCIVKDSSL